MSKGLALAIKLLGIGLIAIATVAFLPQARDWLALWYATLDYTFKLFINLVAISFTALAIAALLSPLEALGWWAGWYKSELDTSFQDFSTATPARYVERYVVYLDGINQDEFEYLENVEEFLERLAAMLPNQVLLGRRIMAYSVLNQPLVDRNRPLNFLWRWVDWRSDNYSRGLLDALVNLRNVLIVSVSADRRYGPIYNQGSAQVILNSLLRHGYQIGSGIPVTLLGYSGGAQISAGAAAYLRKAIAAPIDLISLGGVISGNNGYFHLRHLYHLVGKKDTVERLGPLLFPGRRFLFFWSNWNRGKRRGKIKIVPMGDMTHNGANGYLDANAKLPDGRSHLSHTLDIIEGILSQDSPVTVIPNRRESNYEIYRQAPFNQPNYYPSNQLITSESYQPIGTWMGRLILPLKERRQTVKGVLFEVYHADGRNQSLVGEVVNLRWSDDPDIRDYVLSVTRDVHFGEQTYDSKRNGNLHPDRLNNWYRVDPLESLAGSRPDDDIIVMLSEPVVVEDNDRETRPTLLISREPIQIAGRFYGLVRVLQPVSDDSEKFRVVHFNPRSRRFDDREEIIRIPQVLANANGAFPSSNREIEKSPLNPRGWYIYGATDERGMFVVRAIAPRALFQLELDEVVMGEKEAIDYIKDESWRQTRAQKGTVKTALLVPKPKPIDEAISEWQLGDRLIVMHLFGGIGGKKGEFAPMGIYFGHFAFGVAQVIRDRLTDELRFDIDYKQVYAQNPDGIISGTMTWQKYMGDRQFGWLGSRPASDILVKLEAIAQDYDFDGIQLSPWNEFIRQLDIMAARYRIGDGQGGTYVGPASSCVQDSFQALYVAIERIEAEITSRPYIQDWLRRHPYHPQTRRYNRLVRLAQSLERVLVPLGIVRSDWQNSTQTLGISPEEHPLESFFKGLGSWRTMLPRLAHDEMAEIFLKLGASLWVLRTNQVGGRDRDIEPMAPTTL